MNIRPITPSPSFKANLLFEQFPDGAQHYIARKISIELDPRKITSLKEDCYATYGNYTNKKRETTITDDNNTKYIVQQSLKAVKELVQKAKQSPEDAESVLVDNLIKIV